MDFLQRIFNEINEQTINPKANFDKILQRVNFEIENDYAEFYEPSYFGFDNFDKRHDEDIRLYVERYGAPPSPFYYNDYDYNLTEDREKLINLIRSDYDKGTFCTIATCKCGMYKGNYYLGTSFICEECGTSPAPPVDFNFKTKLWLKTPANIAGFLNPAIYTIFLTKLKTKSSKVELVRFWIDRKYRNSLFKGEEKKGFKSDYEQIEIIRRNLGLEYGYNTFINNINAIIVEFLNFKILYLDKETLRREDLIEFWNKYKDCAVSHYLPIPHKIMSIVENDKRDKYYSQQQLDVNAAFHKMADLFPADDERSINNERRFVHIYVSLVEALMKLKQMLVFGKRGSIRHSAGAGKLPFTGRSVISGESGICRSDVITLPWHFVLTVLEKHLLSWLYRKGYPPLKARSLIVNAARRLCPVILEFVEQIENNNDVMVIAGRNPSIVYLSARTMYARFNRDISDLSIRIPITTTRAYGGDFDGDQMYMRLVTDLDGKIKSYSNWGHQLSLSSTDLFKPGRFAFQTKANVLNVNSYINNTPIKKLNEY